MKHQPSTHAQKPTAPPCEMDVRLMQQMVTAASSSLTPEMRTLLIARAHLRSRNNPSAIMRALVAFKRAIKDADSDELSLQLVRVKHIVGIARKVMKVTAKRELRQYEQQLVVLTAEYGSSSRLVNTALKKSIQLCGHVRSSLLSPAVPGSAPSA